MAKNKTSGKYDFKDNLNNKIFASIQMASTLHQICPKTLP
jgi:hypothetical protein